LIYYSHVNEDNKVEKDIMNNGVYKELFCVAGSGERLIALLNHNNLQYVRIIDNNQDALFLTELKLAALKVFSVTNYLEFIGFKDGHSNRILEFEKLAFLLSPGCYKYWQNHLSLIKVGVLHCGQFEKFLKRIRPGLKIFLGNKFYKCFNTGNYEDQSFPQTRWNFMKWIFSKRWSYRLAGNTDSAFVSKTANQLIIPNGLNQTLKENAVDKNCMFHLIFKGNLLSMKEKNLPVSFQRKELEGIKMALEKKSFQMTFHNQDLLDFIKQFDFSNCNESFFSISDILSFENKFYLSQFIGAVKTRSKNKSTVISRSFLNHRMNTDDLTQLKNNGISIKDHSHLEQTRMYQVIENSMRS